MALIYIQPFVYRNMQIYHATRLLQEVCALRHLAINTEKAYLHWLGRYAAFLKDPKFKTLPTEDKLEAFLTSLALTGVSASTQNQGCPQAGIGPHRFSARQTTSRASSLPHPGCCAMPSPIFSCLCRKPTRSRNSSPLKFPQKDAQFSAQLSWTLLRERTTVQYSLLTTLFTDYNYFQFKTEIPQFKTGKLSSKLNYQSTKSSFRFSRSQVRSHYSQPYPG
jgi:Phage integrase, N-terminal SAM-like domain